MRGLIFLGLLACAYGIGDRFPYANTLKNMWEKTEQGKGQWVLNKCDKGTKQSPIDIKDAVIAKEDPGAIMAYGFDLDTPIDWRVDGNDEHYHYAIEAFYPARAQGVVNNPVIVGGPLDQTYQFSHMVFHWGKDADTLGGEHLVDGKRGAMEIQFAFHKTRFTPAQETKREAKATLVPFDKAVVAASEVTGAVDPAGLAVIAYQVDIGDANAELQPIGAAIKAGSTNVKAKMATYSTATNKDRHIPHVDHNVNISSLMMLDKGALEDYYYYDGSLTAPASHTDDKVLHDCAEIVRWIIPTQRLTMSADQYALFHAVAVSKKGGAGTEADRNSRLIQTGTKIADIKLMRRMPVKTTDDAVWRNLAGTLLSVGTFGLVHNLLTQDETAKALTENPVVDILQDIEQRFVRPAAPQERQAFNHHHHPQDIQY